MFPCLRTPNVSIAFRHTERRYVAVTIEQEVLAPHACATVTRDMNAVTVTLRQAHVSDAPAIVIVHRRSSFLPVLDTPKEHLAFLRDREFARSAIWVAEADQRIVGFIAREAEWVHQLHVLPEFQGMGIGSQLLAKAKAENPSGLRLYTYQENHRARAFYEGRGFTNVEFNDVGREEQRPDVLMEWRPNS